jgi:hypothetical protein
MMDPHFPPKRQRRNAFSQGSDRPYSNSGMSTKLGEKVLIDTLKEKEYDYVIVGGKSRP